MSDDQFVDYYALLRITPDASIKEIEGAYKLEVRYWHPDRLINRPIDEQKQAERHFVELGRAREVLSDSDKRLRYDEIYREWTASLGCTTAPADSDPDPSVMSMSELRAWMGLPGPKLGHLQQAATLDRNAAWERAKVLLQRGVFETPILRPIVLLVMLPLVPLLGLVVVAGLVLSPVFTVPVGFWRLAIALGLVRILLCASLAAMVMVGLVALGLEGLAMLLALVGLAGLYFNGLSRDE